MVERDGRLRAGPVRDESAFTLEPIIIENVASGTTITTDGHGAYKSLKHSYEHEAVNHDPKEYVRGIHHTKTAEGDWSLLKRAIKGTHVHVSSKHTWKYIAEFSYRRNMRHSHWAMFNLLVHAFALPRLADG